MRGLARLVHASGAIFRPPIRPPRGGPGYLARPVTNESYYDPERTADIITPEEPSFRPPAERIQVVIPFAACLATSGATNHPELQLR